MGSHELEGNTIWLMLTMGTLPSPKPCASLNPQNRSYNDRHLFESRRQYQSWKVLSFTCLQWGCQRNTLSLKNARVGKNLGLSEKLRENCRCVKCSPSNSNSSCHVNWWYTSGHQAEVWSLRTFLHEWELSQGESRSWGWLTSIGPSLKWDGERKVKWEAL